MISSIGADTVRGRAGFRHQVGIEAQVAGHSDGSLDAHVGKEASDHKTGDTAPAQNNLQICSEKSAVDVLRNDGLSAYRREAIFPRTSWL